jgi:fimbrial chaperone protein
MHPRKSVRVAAPFVLLAFQAMPQALAGSLLIAPTTVTLASPQSVGILYVTNRDSKPTAAQIEGFDWSESGGKDRLDPSDGLIVSPPMARIAPDATQVVRLKAAATASDGRESSFRVLVSQLPDATDFSARGVHFLLQFSIPVFLGGDAKGRPSLAWSATLDQKDLAVTVRNDGQRHAKLTEIVLTGGGHGPVKVNGVFYVLAGGQYMWTFPANAFGGVHRIRIEGRNGNDPAFPPSDVVLNR